MLNRARFCGAAGLFAVSILATSSLSSASLRGSWFAGRTTSLVGCTAHAHASTTAHANMSDSRVILFNTQAFWQQRRQLASPSTSMFWMQTRLCTLTGAYSSGRGEGASDTAAAAALSLADFFSCITKSPGRCQGFLAAVLVGRVAAAALLCCCRKKLHTLSSLLPRNPDNIGISSS